MSARPSENFGRAGVVFLVQLFFFVGDGASTSRKTIGIFILRQTSSTASGPPSPKGKAREVRIAASCFTAVGDGVRNVSLFYIVGDGASTSRKTIVNFILRQTYSTANGPPSPKGKAREVRIAASCFTAVGDGVRNVSLFYIVGDGASTSRKTIGIFILRQTSSTASGPPSPKGKARAV